MERHALQEIIDSASHHWWYRVRRQIIRDLLGVYRPPKEGVFVLDVGCGAGDTMQSLTDLYRVEGVDVSLDVVTSAVRRGLTVRQAILPAIPYPDNSVDVVLMLDVLEHIQDDQEALREIYRVLKPGGTCIIFVPAFMFLWGTNDNDSHHFRRYTKKPLTTAIERCGLVTQRATYFNTFLFPFVAFTRFVVHIFSIPVKSEVGLTTGFLNELLFSIFYLESRLLRFFNFPFGVSLCIVCRKP